MWSVIGELLPLSMVIALSPIPVIAVVLILLSPKASTLGPCFMAGWLAGITASIVIMTLLSTIIPERDPDESSPTAGLIKLALGALLILMAVKQWRGRPTDGSEPELPGWMNAIGTLSAVKAIGFGLLLSAPNPKNFLLAGAAGVTIGATDLSTQNSIIAAAAFVLLASASVVVPVIAHQITGKSMDPFLAQVHRWMVANNTTIMIVLKLFIGINVIGQGIGAF
jgi:threonine/homoserine/homoserine lactone efflux protein